MIICARINQLVELDRKQDVVIHLRKLLNLEAQTLKSSASQKRIVEQGYICINTYN